MAEAAAAAGYRLYEYSRDPVKIAEGRLNMATVPLALSEGKVRGVCRRGLPGWRDARVGGSVVLRDGNGSVLATAPLTGGVLDARGCHLTWSAAVPETPFVSVALGSRAGVTFSSTQLTSRGNRADTVYGER